MNSCRVLNKDSFIDELITICNECAALDLKLGSLLLEKKVKELIENARTTSDPDQQLNFLNEALDEFYNNPDDDYGEFLSVMLPVGIKNALFNVNYNNTLAEDKTFSSTFEEKAKASRKQRLKNFISSKFKDAPNAKLYFQRSVLNDIVETFFVKRSGDNPRIFESQEEMNENVRMYKQELLDRIFEYFEENALLKNKVSGLQRKMYTKAGDYTGVIEAVKNVFDNYLSSEAFQSRKLKSLEEFYKDYRDGRPDVRKNAERFLNAYNAWLMLTNFDTLVRDIIGSTIEIKDDSNYDRHTGDLTKYKIRGKATNIWSNWTNSDDITDMSEIISDVTLYLINTSRMYKWGSDEAYPDRYVSFHDFNYTIGLIKKLVFDPKSNTLALRNLEGIDKVSLHTKKLMLEMLQWNRVNETGDVITNEDGSKTIIPREVTWKQLISRINENPQKYLHAAFDILCNTNILDEFQLNTYEKSLIWSFYKELFGGDQNPRSLFNLHNLTSKDGIYLIITQVAASTFPEDYLQYYEKNNGSIGTRLLKDFALDNIKRNLLDNILLTGAVLSDVQYKKFGVTYISRANTNDSYLQEVNIEIKTTFGDRFKISTNNLNIRVEFDVNRSDEIWNSPEVRLLFKEILGVNFDADPDLQNAYLEQVGHSSFGLDDLGKLVGRILYTSIINTKYVPKHRNATTYESALKTFLKNQYGEALAKEYNKGIKYDTGYISVLPVNVKDSALNNLAMAVAINSNILALAQSKTGEGTALANYTLSRMRNFFQNQIEMQCKRVNSALKNMTFVVNNNNLFEGILSRRELKTLKSNQQSTKFSDQDSFTLSFVNDFIASFVPDPDPNSYIKNGRASFLPTVNSDKTQIDGLLVNLNAKTRIPNERGGYKTYLELTDDEIELEMVSEFKSMYDKIIANINKELLKVYQILPESIKSKYLLTDQGDVISNNDLILNAINQAYAYDTSLGKNVKKRILNGLHRDITKYNKTHGRKPIMLAPNIHYTFNSNGLLEGNHTLQALWGRFNSNMSDATHAKLIQMYADEKDYLAYMQRNGLIDPLNSHSFFKYKEHLTIENLLKMKFNIKLFGSDSVVRHDSKEIQFLRGEAKFTELQLKDSKYQHLQSLNLEMKNWINYDNGTMILAKGIINGIETNITTLNQLKQATNLRIHPMLSKLNRLDYLCSLQYTIATVGSHYAHSGGAGGGSVLVEEAKRWLASNKRNVAATSTVHLFQNKQLDGSPSVYNVAIIEDVTFDLYNVMGDLYKEGHKPLDGGMMVSAFVPDLENNSLAGEKAGLDKKLFGTFFSELYGAGGIVKTAGFAGTNARMRRQKAWLNIQKAMSSKPWTKEFPDENGEDILEILDITKDYFNNPIDYRAAINGLQIMYKRPAYDNPSELAAYRLLNIESLGNNLYKIWEIEIDLYGAEISSPVPRIENGSDIITINNNWDLYTKVFGGFNSLEIGSDNRLTWSENSVKLMVYAMNNVGYRKKNDNLMKDAEMEFGEEVTAQLKLHNDNVKTGLDLDDIWQPLKYSEIHYMPNIGAIKSLQFNVNPDGNAVYEGRAEINHMVMRLAQLGILLDKEHHADASEVSMPTQIIQATANRSFTSEYTREIYKALNTLTRLVTKPFIEGIKDIITSNDPTTLVEEVSNLLVEKLLSKKDDESSVTSILQDILQKAEEGKTLKFADDLKGKIPWSDPTISSKLFSELSTTLTNLAVKMKFAGTLSVICPTDPIEKLYGDKLLNSFTRIFDEKTGSTRTKLPKNNITEYQLSVKNGNEVDSDGRNMLIYNLNRDSVSFEIINYVRNILMNTLTRSEENFNRLLSIDDNEITEHLTQALSRMKYEWTEEVDLYLKDVINILKNANISYVDFVVGVVLKHLTSVGFNEALIQTIEEIRNLYLQSVKEDATSILPYTTFKQYKPLLEEVFSISSVFEYNKLKKGYEVPLNLLLAITKAINLIGPNATDEVIKVFSDSMELQYPITTTTKILEVEVILNEIEKNKSANSGNARRKTLSQLSNLKTLHNYIIEFEDGPSERITINTPEDYYRVKNLVILGKRSESLQSLISPVTEEELFEKALEEAKSNYDFSQDKYAIVCGALSKPVLLQESYKKELGVGQTEIKKMFGLFLSKDKGGKSIDHLAEDIWRNNEALFEDDLEVRSLIIEILLESETTKDIKSHENKQLVEIAKQLAYEDYASYVTYLATQYKKTPEEYALFYTQQSKGVNVTKIYEDVETGRALSAYNVRYTDVNTGNRFLIYDLDSINLLFKLNNLMTEKEIKGYELFTNLNEIKQQLIFNQIFGSNVFKEIIRPFYQVLSKKYTQIPHFDSNFIANLKMMYPELFVNFINDFYTILKPFVYNYMQTDLKKLSSNYDKADRKVFANGTLIEPTDIETDAYELIMPKIYKTLFGLLEFDDLQTILRDKDFFVKRGLQRFQCKLDHKSYDYELKNFNGEHYYILDKKQGIPDHIALNVLQIWTDTRKKKHYRVDSDGNIIYEMSSKDDVVCKLGNVQIIVTDNPLFYVQNLNYNTLKVSPERVTEESYLTLINTLSLSKRINSKNFLKAISNPDESYFDLKTFKEFNIAIDKLDYATVKLGDRNEKDFKSVALLCRTILQNGRELHTAFNESLNLIAGRIPALSQQSFMTQRVIGFDNADLNTAMVSTFQLFLQGSDLDIDAVTLLGYEFDKNGKFVAWSPYFKSDSKENLEASKNIPLPTGEIKEIYADFKAPDNFFETYDQYFGTIFKTIPLPTGGIKTINGVPELILDLESPENLKLFALFLRDFNEKGINIKGTVNKNGIIDVNSNVDFYKAPDVTLEDGTTVKRSWNLFTSLKQGGSIGARPEQTYAIAKQLLQFANIHNNYLNIAEEHLRDKMSKNYIVHYIYKVSEAPCNQTEALLGIDLATFVLKQAAKNSDMATASDSFAPGGYETKHKAVGEGQVGKSGVGIGAVAIKANSTTLFYLSELWNHGSDWDKDKILFKHPIYINGKSYYGFANMYTSKEFSLQEIEKFTHALNILNSLEDPSQITLDVAVNIASLLSIAVDNAKDLALKKINSGHRLMGLYAYGMTLGISINELVDIINSPLGLIITEMTEGSVYNNDPSLFKVIDIFSKLDGYITGDLEKFAVIARGIDNKPIKKMFKPTIGNTKQLLEFGKTTDTIFALLYETYADWFDKDEALKMEKIKNPKFQIASNLSEMLHLLIKYNTFSKIYERSLRSVTYQSYTQFLSSITDSTTQNNYKASIGQMIKYIKDIEQKAELFRRDKGSDLRTLAEGAEEMRILGSILSINKGLKPSTVEAEAFIDTIENLIYDRRKVLGYLVSESDKIDFFKFMTDEEYLKKVVDTYEAIKHSVNIPHLLLKAPHFNGYLETQMIPLAFFTATSIKHRIVHKYRKNVEADYDSASEKHVGLFDLLGLESKSDKEHALKGLENLIHFKLFTRWAYDKLLRFTVPKDFLFFTKKGTLTFNPDGELNLLLYTEAGLASFKKYMEEVYIPLLQADPILGTNEFIKNLDKISFDKTSLHNSVTTYSLTGDLMAKSGRLGELNAKMFADFQVLSKVKFQPENGIPSLLDAFYLYAQYVYMGKKGTKSLMNAFDSINPTLKESFTKHIALMDSEGHLSCSKEELILWCAPVGTLSSSANYAYVNLGGLFGKSLGIKIKTNIRLDEDQLEAYNLALEDNEEEGQPKKRKENYGVYKPEYLATAYDRLTRNHFLVPSTTEKVAFTETIPLHGALENGQVTLLIKLDMVFDCSFNTNLKNNIEAKIKDGTVSKFKSVEDFRLTLKSTLKSLHIPYKTTLTSDKRQLIDLGVIETIINHLLNC